MANDLAERHELVSDLFQLPQTQDEWSAFKLTAAQLEHFDRHGYVAGIRVLDDDQVETLRDQLQSLADPGAPGHELFYEFHSNESATPETVLFHALGGWRIAPAFHDLLWHPALTVPAVQLLGGSARFWHDQLFCKPPRHGGVVAWHQDYSYWTRTRPMAHLTVWIALDDATEASGCISYIPGSHRWDLKPVTGLAGDMDSIAQVLDEDELAAFQPTPVELRRGEASLHHPLTIHGSRENTTDRPRRAAVVNLMRDGVCSASDEPLLAGVPPVPSGQPVAGKFFPLLLDAATLGA